MIDFKATYNRDTFLEFLKTSFLPESTNYKLKVIDKKYKVINEVFELGHNEDLELSILEMSHNRNNDPRISIATDAFKIMSDLFIQKALVIFKNEDTNNYRFSFLTITLDINEKDKVVKSYSNARRYSFFLGENAKVKTPEQQLIKQGKIKDIDDLQKRFSVEVVNKQFYLEIAKLFDELVKLENENLTLPNKNEDMVVRKSFAVRLIGRIVFSWFLKQKNSTAGKLVPDEILSSSVINDNGNYYHNLLEPLFFGILNTPIGSRDIRGRFFDQVPYLNGGLFNPQGEDFYEFEKATFSSRFINTLIIQNKWFKSFFDLLETYNFTIDENTVFDLELSVDPEMLGRIFENLLAEINPESGISERKRTGSFYTPRQIVEYMVDQSLVEYLSTKTEIERQKLEALVSYDLNDDKNFPLTDEEKIKVVQSVQALKVLDPACGSGAFPIGILQKIVYILQNVDPNCDLWLAETLKNVPDLYRGSILNHFKNNPPEYTRKLEVIKNSIFGVDIQPIAVDVSRLRCFLTLIVESEINDTKSNRGIEPLPNLDFKFVCANTLIGLPKEKNEQQNLFDDVEGIHDLSNIMSEYFSANNARKFELKQKFVITQKNIIQRTVMNHGNSTGAMTLKLTTWDPFENKSNDWFDPKWMFGLEEKFDVVIGNPPYIDSETMVQNGQSDFREYIQSNYKWTRGNWDIYIAFFESGFNCLSNYGILTFITPDKWISKPFGLELRKGLIKHIKIILKSGRGVFDSAKVDSIVTFITHRIDKNISIVDYDDNKFKERTRINKNILGDTFSLDHLFSENLELINKLSLMPNKLITLGKCENACATSDAYSLKPLILNLQSDSDYNNEKYLKIINTGTISKFTSRWSEKTMTYLGDKYSFPVVDKTEFLKIFKNSYGKKSSEVKIILKGLNLLDGTLDLKGEIIPGKTTLIITSSDINNLKFIAGLINSKFPIWYIKEKYPGASYNQGTSFTKDMINNLPLPEITISKKILFQKIIEAVDYITDNRNSDKGEMIKSIDKFVYRLYDLTDDEIKIIEGN